VLLQLRDDLLLVGDGERGGRQDGGELGILLENGAEGVERLCGAVEGVGLRGGRVLCSEQKLLAMPLSARKQASGSNWQPSGARETYQGRGVGSVDAEEGDGGLVLRAGAGGCGGSVGAGCDDAGGEGGARGDAARGAGEGPAGEHDCRGAEMAG
jgi:hypothetical protein